MLTSLHGMRACTPHAHARAAHARMGQVAMRPRSLRCCICAVHGWIATCARPCMHGCIDPPQVYKPRPAAARSDAPGTFPQLPPECWRRRRGRHRAPRALGVSLLALGLRLAYMCTQLSAVFISIIVGGVMKCGAWMPHVDRLHSMSVVPSPRTVDVRRPPTTRSSAVAFAS